MRVVVAGGTGLIGRKLVERLSRQGHEAVPTSRTTGVDLLTGAGLGAVLDGADAVVDVTNPSSFVPDEIMDFFTRSTRVLLSEGAAAGVRHHVVLSIVGVDRAPDSPYLRAKLAQEQLAREGGVPFTVVRATQFFEFLRTIVDASTAGTTARLTPAALQPIAADDVVEMIADVLIAPPVGGVIEIAGPDRIGLDELARRVLGAAGDSREVISDRTAAYFGAVLDDDTLTAGPGARIAPKSLSAWLARSATAGE